MTGVVRPRLLGTGTGAGAGAAVGAGTAPTPPPSTYSGPMTKPAWIPPDSPLVDSPLADPPAVTRSERSVQRGLNGRGRGLRSWVLAILGCLPIGVVVAFWLRALPVTVRSDAELASVGFGWPLAWTVQDHTRYAPQQFPMTAEYLGPKGMADPLATQVDWSAFALNCLFFWVVACGALMLVAWIMRTVRRAGPAEAQGHANASAKAGGA